MSLTYSGSLQIKKKGELKDICQSLHIDDSGTREELQHRIKKHLDDNSAELENDPAFSGLYTTRGGRRQRSLQPSNAHQTGHVAEPPKFSAIPEEGTVTPPREEPQDTSTLAGSSQTPVSSPRSSPRKTATPRTVAVSQPSSPAKTVVSHASETPEVEVAEQVSQTFAERLTQTVFFLRVVSSLSLI